MHGKKREEYKAKFRDPKTAKILSQKAEQWYVLMGELSKRRVLSEEQKEAGNVDEKNTAVTLGMIGKAVMVNPDPMNLWNHRRELILDEAEGNDESATAAIVERERSLTTTALQRNPKAYGAWFHRKWLLQKFRPSTSVLNEELHLTAVFLEADERNFHCWNYRRFVVACLGGSWDGEWRIGAPITSTHNNNDVLMGTQVAEKPPSKPSCIPSHLIASEFEFTTKKITQNFSNFSAFHYRFQLLELYSEDAANDDPASPISQTVLGDLLDTEFGLVEDAVCTEPDDQTCWWYHAILLDMVIGHSQTKDDDQESLLERFLERLQSQAELFQEILEDSPDSKWVILGLFKVLQVLGRESDNDEERQTLLTKLQQIDPYRSNRYEYLRKQQV